MVRRGYRRVAGMALVLVGLGVGAGVAEARWISIEQTPLNTSAESAPPSTAGSWTHPFEEGGSEEPRCVPEGNQQEPDRVVCKPTAVGQAELPNGTLLYVNGIESSENTKITWFQDLGPQSRNSKSRLLDLRSGTPRWTIPTNNTGGGTNPNIEPGRTSEDCLKENPEGVLGVPGRPGDGLVGSLVGTVGGPESDPTCSPDDVQANDWDMFCADMAQLFNGNILSVGGTDWYNEPSLLEKAKGDDADVGWLELEGLRSSRVYDWDDQIWRVTAPMKFGRWYPGLVTLSDGKVLSASGVTKLVKDSQLSQVRRTETYDPKTNKWHENYTGSASENTLPLNPRLFLTPNGKVLYDGVGQMWGPGAASADEALYGLVQFFDPKTEEWQVAGGDNVVVPRSMAHSVPLPMKPPYDEMSILTFGGTLGPTPGTYGSVGLTTITTVGKDDTVRRKRTSDMQIARWFPSGVALPDGQIMAVNGANNDGVLGPGTEVAIRTPEIYDPATETWRKVNSQSRDRTYHSSATLLPDGRVLAGGHSPFATLYGTQHDLIHGVTANNDKDPSFEVYSPPYLFWGKRPHIDRVQAGVQWRQSFAIHSDEAKDITKVMLVRMPSPQHTFDSDVRTLELTFKRDGDTLIAKAPPDGVVAPPGFYYLFVDRNEPGKGLVPSVARIVQLGSESSSRPALEPMNGQPITGGSATPDPDSSYIAQPPDPLPAEGAG